MLLSLPLGDFSSDFAVRLFVIQYLVLDPHDQFGERFLAANLYPTQSCHLSSTWRGGESADESW